MRRYLLLTLLTFLSATACGDDDADADALGIGAACNSTSTCGENQRCLTTFKGGYCGSVGCSSNEQCPTNSACVTHTDGNNYCFRTCLEKSDCNAHRDVTVESNCVSSVVFVSGKKEGKICEPPNA